MIFAVLGCFFAVVALALDAATADEIEYLLSVVENSECSFIRNGDAHSGSEAVEHMRKKYDHFADRIDSAESFIEYSATRSLLSGKNYTVECPENDPQPTSQWLLLQLESFRNGKTAMQSTPL